MLFKFYFAENDGRPNIRNPSLIAVNLQRLWTTLDRWTAGTDDVFYWCQNSTVGTRSTFAKSKSIESKTRLIQTPQSWIQDQGHSKVPQHYWLPHLTLITDEGKCLLARTGGFVDQRRKWRLLFSTGISEAPCAPCREEPTPPPRYSRLACRAPKNK